MGRRIYPLNRIKYWWAYTVDEICNMYSDSNLHPQTVRTWIGKGMVTMKGKPTLIYGNELKKFLQKSNESNQCQTQFDEMFCMKCKDAKKFYKNQIKIELKNGALQGKSHCRDCKTVMNKGYSFDNYQKIRKSFIVVDVLQLYDCENPPLKTHLDAPEQTHASEPMQQELFI